MPVGYYALRGLGQLLQPDSISIPVGEDRSPYPATAAGEAGESTEEKTAFVSKPGQTGRTTKASRQHGVFQQEKVGAFSDSCCNESLSK